MGLGLVLHASSTCGFVVTHGDAESTGRVDGEKKMQYRVAQPAGMHDLGF